MPSRMRKTLYAPATRCPIGPFVLTASQIACGFDEKKTYIFSDINIFLEGLGGFARVMWEISTV